MRADRLLALLLSLQAEGRLTAKVLAARFEVSERTIYRDIEALCIAGVPISTQTGTQGGITLDAKYRTSLTGLSLAELRALFVASNVGPLRDLGLTDAVGGMQVKLAAALPARHHHEVQRLRQRFYIDSNRWFDYHEPSAVLPQLQEAVWDDRQITIVYRNDAGVTSEQTLDAYALVAKANIWYLIARTSDGIYRTYRTERIATLTLLAAQFTRDPAFDPAIYWNEQQRAFEQMREATFPFYPAVVRLTVPAFEILRHYVPQRYQPLDVPELVGWLTVRVLFLSLHEARMHVLGLGTQIRVIEPAELQQTVLDTAHAVASMDENPGG